MSLNDLLNNAIKKLGKKHFFRDPNNNLNIKVELIYPNANRWRPLRIDWWRGKQVYLIGEDVDGNYIVRHCSGAVYYFDLNNKKSTEISNSVKDFLSKLTE
jgi:hypothetical protein